MGCNCGGSKSSAKTQQYVFVDQSGKKSAPMTQVQANAAKIRAGGAGTVKPA